MTNVGTVLLKQPLEYDAGAVLGIFIRVGQSKGQANFRVVYVGQTFVWVGQAQVWVGHGLPGLIA